MDEREVLRCPHCRLRQFRTAGGNCRRCRKPYAEPELRGTVVVAEVDARLKTITLDAVPRTCSGSTDIAFAVRLLRQARGLSQRQLARKMGAQRTYISKVERDVLPTIPSFQKIAAALEVEPWVLLYFADPDIEPTRKAA